MGEAQACPITNPSLLLGASQAALVVQSLPASVGDIRSLSMGCERDRHDLTTKQHQQKHTKQHQLVGYRP